MKPTLLLLHGALGSKKQFDKIIPLLNDSYEVHCFSFEGHGGVVSNKSYTMDLFVENTFQYIEENNLEGTAVFGYSMGGYVALTLALKYPKVIRKIVTLGTKFDWSKEATEKEVRMLDPEKIKEKVPRFAAKLEQEHTPLDWEIVMTKTAGMMMELSKGAGISNDQFKHISHPVTIGLGTNDQMVTYAESEQVSQLLPNGKIATAENFPHPIDKIETQQLASFITGAFII